MRKLGPRKIKKPFLKSHRSGFELGASGSESKAKYTIPQLNLQMKKRVKKSVIGRQSPVYQSADESREIIWPKRY